MNDDQAIAGAPVHLAALDLDLAPQTPGIYAWYAQLALSDDDWKPRIRDRVDRAGDDLTRAIADYVRIHDPMPLHLSGSGSYGLNWAGVLSRESVHSSNVVDTPSRLESKLESMAGNPVRRRILTSLLRSATPVFASPLYIGVASNLNRRLSEHRTAFEEAKAALRTRGSRSRELQFEGETLGARLAGSGIQLEHLSCWILPIPELPQSSSSLKLIGGDAEWLLQRTFQPVLGRN